jgi:ABC-type antimicrobial peptide transport system permease subunit
MKVAFGVVLQGIRIRFGRSLVTLSGVVLGVAFLMSILSGIILRQGVAAEDALRMEARRMRNFLEAETGAVERRDFAIIPLAPPAPAELRFLDRLRRARPASLRLYDPQGFVPEGLAVHFEVSALEEIGADISGLLFIGAGSMADWYPQLPTLMEGARQGVVAFSSPRAQLLETGDLIFVRLSRELRAEEIRAREEQARMDRFRNTWIACISVLVTVMGIANAMLMSVTERFREIGTMKCLGALSAFVRRMFIIESAIMGTVGGIVGSLTGLLFTLVAYTFTYGPGLVFSGLAAGAGQTALFAVSSVVMGIVLSMLAALYPAAVAARMLPAVALRSNV